MARSYSTSSSARLSQIRSSRVIRIDTFESGDDIYKFFPNRFSIPRATRNSYFGFEIKPSPIGGSRKRLGYDLKFEVPTKETSSKLQKERKSFQVPPDNISLSSVQYSLAHKGDLPSAQSWQGEAMLGSESFADNYQRPSDGRKVVYRGNLSRIGEPRITYVRNANDVNTLTSVFVLASTIDASQSTILWSWPWLDRRQSAYELYQTKGEIYCIESQDLLLPRLDFPIQAQMFVCYLKSVKPCVTNSTFQTTRKAVEDFALKYGAEFHQNLYEECASHDNWIETCMPNLHHEYTLEEAPLINLAVIAPFCHDLWPEQANSLLPRACKVIRHVTEFWNLIRTQTLKGIVDEEGHSLCMHQFLNLFNSVKVPGLPVAAACTFFNAGKSGDTPQNIIVICRGLVYSVNVLDENLEPLPNLYIEHSLKEILLFSNKSSFPSVGILTAANMGTWGVIRGHLISMSRMNEASLMEIERAMFVLSLDHKNVRGLDVLANESLFGDGFNRWYDKGLSIYIHNNGLVTLNVNRTLLDGPTVSHLLHFMHLRLKEDAEEWDEKSSQSESSHALPSPVGSTKRLSKAEEIHMQVLKLEEMNRRYERETRLSSLSATETQALRFEIDDYIEQEIEICTNRFNFLASLLMTAVSKNDQVEEIFFTQLRIHKDAFAHMVIHLTYFKMYFTMASIGCKISLLKFYKKSYDILRSTSSEMADWCKAMLDPEVDQKQKRVLYQKAEKVHLTLLANCYNGKGCDNYINAMSQMVKESKDVPRGNMFDDVGFEQAGWEECYDIYAESMGLGCTSCPVVLPATYSGYGVGYSVATSFIMFTVSSWRGESRTCANLFAASLDLNVKSLIKTIKSWNSE